MTKRLTVADLLSFPDAPNMTKEIDIPGTGVVTVKAFSLNDHREMLREARLGDVFDWPRWHALLLQHGMAEPQLSYDEAAQLCLKGMGVVNLIIDAILDLCGLTDMGEVSSKAVDKLEATFPQGSDPVPGVPAG